MEATVIFHTNETDTQLLATQICNGHFETLRISNTLKIAVYNTQTLNRFIKEETQHEHKILATEKQQALKTMSGGEQKKAMLNYLVSLTPEALILDNPFDHLDVESRNILMKQLEELSKNTYLILLASRKSDAPDFIKKKWLLENERLVDFKEENQTENIPQAILIPPPISPQTYEKEFLIQLKNIQVSYAEKPILHNIKWDIKPGEFWQLIGPNGSGKTTLLSMITGDNVKGYGQELYLFGNKKGSGENVWELKEKIGYFTTSLIQEFNHNYTALEMILGGFFDAVGLYNKPTDLQLNIAKQWLKVLQLESEANTKFNKLSIGKQRMVMIARAMVKHPLLLILDEPTTGLDDKNAALMVTFVNKIVHESNTTILYVSHRAEKGLQPDYNYILTPTTKGSIGHIN